MQQKVTDAAKGADKVTDIAKGADKATDASKLSAQTRNKIDEVIDHAEKNKGNSLHKKGKTPKTFDNDGRNGGQVLPKKIRMVILLLIKNTMLVIQR